MGIGSQLSQTREYRDLFEDVLTRIGEPLEEAGMSKDNINDFLVACGCFLDGIIDDGRDSRRPSSVASQLQTNEVSFNDRYLMVTIIHIWLHL